MVLRSRNTLSLCAGVGGLELGIALALHYRGETARGICYVEREASAAASLVASMEAGWVHPALVWSDLLTFDARPLRGLVHILASGDPCQDNSVAGKRAGAEGERFLAPEVVRIADECRPDLIFRENVPGNLAEQLAALAPPLEGLGYRIAAGIFSSAETGNTMRRERAFIMAERIGCLDAWREPIAGKEASGWPCGQSGGRGGELARAPLQRPGEARGDFGRPEEWSAGAERALGSPERGGDGRLTSHAGRGALGRIVADGAGCGAIGAVGGSGGTEPQGQQRGQHLSPGRQVKGGHSLLSGRTILPPAVIPGPTDSRWIDVLDRWPELQPALSQEEAESHLRRGVDAMAHRVERLRATGNGVDPVVAAYAFLSLDALLAESRGTGASVVRLAA